MQCMLCTHANISRAGKELSEAVEGAGHHAVRSVEGLLHTVTVVDIDVDVKNAGVDAQQLKDTENADVSCVRPRSTHMSFT